MPPRPHVRQRGLPGLPLACALLAGVTTLCLPTAPLVIEPVPVAPSASVGGAITALDGKAAAHRTTEAPAAAPATAPAWVRPLGRPEIPLDALHAAARGETGNVAFVLENGRFRTDGRVTRVVRRSGRSFSLLGTFPGLETDGSWSLALRGQSVVANFRLPDGGPLLEWRVTPEGEPLEREIDAGLLPPCEASSIDPPLMADGPVPPTAPVPDAPKATRNETAPPPMFGDDPVGVPEVALLVVYTPAAVLAAGGAEVMEALVYLSLDETNAALADSLAVPRMRLVHHQMLDYIETENDLRIDLTRLRTKGDSFLYEVHELRDTVGADLVSLVVVNDESCGLAYTLVSDSQNFADYAFSVVAEDCMATNYSFSHEIAHNLGCQHAAGDDNGAVIQGQGIFPYAHGWRFNAATVDGTLYRTIMAQSPGARVPFFSSPDILVAGTPAGIADLADSVRTINRTAPAAALWRNTPRTLFGDALEQPDWIFQSGGDAPWTEQPIERRDGMNALQAGFIPDNGASWLQTIREGPLQIEFFWKADFTDPDSILTVSVDGTEYARVDSGMPWRRQMIRIPSGNHVVRWTQARGALGDSLDAVAWLDQIAVSDVPMVIHDIHAQGTPVQSVDLLFESIPFQEYLLETTTDMIVWRNLRTLRPDVPSDRRTGIHVVIPQSTGNIRDAGFRIRMLP